MFEGIKMQMKYWKFQGGGGGPSSINVVSIPIIQKKVLPPLYSKKSGGSQTSQFSRITT